MKMQAIVATGTGGVEVLQRQEVYLPWPAGEHDVLVRLHAAALNPADSFFRQLGGSVQGPHPFVLGHDGAGVVEAVGKAVTAVVPGDRVCFCYGGIGGAMGTYAEASVVPDALLAKIPDGVSFETAAALPLVSITAWESLYDRARLTAGEHALIHAGAGGTGHVAIQLAKLRAAKVATTVSSTNKAAFVEGLGADLVIRYREEDFVEAVRRWCNGIDVALDNVGGETLLRTYRAMSVYGRIVTLMGSAGDDAELTAYNQNLSVINEMMLTPMWRGLFSRMVEHATIIRECLFLVASGKLNVHLDAQFGLSEIADAHSMLDRGGATGKIVLSTR